MIQRASERALKTRNDSRQVLKLAAEIREHSQSTGLIIFSYLNPILRMGLEKFCQAARQAGVDGALVTDLPFEESGEYLRAMRQNNLATVFLAAPTSPDERLKLIAQHSTGFVYASFSHRRYRSTPAVCRKKRAKLVRRLRKFTKLPIAVGFGISTPEQFAAVGKFADGAVIGSAIVETIERNPGKEAESVAQFIRSVGRWPLVVGQTTGYIQLERRQEANDQGRQRTAALWTFPTGVRKSTTWTANW